MQNLEKRKIFVIFSSTPLKIGKFIRAITNNKYNHVSISLDPTFQTMYSFSRFYKHIPFYGGFVKESSLRYKNKKKYATIKVCEIEVSDEKFNYLKDYFNLLEENFDKYLYNLFSAIFTPLKKRILIKDSYTCIEFAIDTLSKIDNTIIPGKFYTINELEQHLKNNVIYEGIIKIKHKQDFYKYDHFLDKKDFFQNVYYTFIAVKRLSGRMIKNRHKNEGK